MKRLTNIVSFNARSDAEHLKSWLLHKNVPAQIQDETRLQKYWFWTAPRAGIHLQIPNDWFEGVQAVLHKRDAARLLRRAVHCPSCGSLRVQYPDLTRKNFLPTLFIQLFVLLRVARHNYYCEDCHFTWLPKSKRRRRGRLDRRHSH